MVTSITEIYNDVLNSLPYSLKGHNNIEEKLHKFYNKLIETNFLKHSDKYTFLCSALLRLPSVTQQEKESKTILENWELSSFDNIFYKTFIEGDKDEALSFYFYLLKWAGSKCGVKSLSTSQILSKFFIADLDFKVGLIPDLIIEKPYVKYDKRRHLFEIFIPKSIFKTTNFENLPHLRLELNKMWHAREKMIKRKDVEGRLYVVDTPQSFNHFEQIFDLLFYENKIDGVVSVLTNEYFKEFSKFRLYSNDEALFTLVSYCSVCISFLCLYYDCYVEYMLSIAKVDYKPGFRNNEYVSIPEYRNIGGLILGYNCNSVLTQEERVIFNLTSDRLASVIAGQYLYEEIEELKFKGKGYTLLKDFWDSILKDLTHSSSTVAKIDSALSLVERKLAELQRVLSRSTFEKICKYINGLRNSSSNYHEYISNNCDSIKDAIRIEPASWANKIKDEFQIDVSGDTATLMDYVFCDTEYINHLIRSSITNSKDKNKANTNLKVELIIKLLKQDGNLTTDLSESVCIEFILQDNGCGCELENIILSSTTYHPILNEYRQIVNSFGEIELVSKAKSLLFSPDKEIRNSIIVMNGFKTTIKIYKNG
ncbi:MAG: hypothetical protein U0U70_04270 [Chitinophagaceae bacterium]